MLAASRRAREQLRGVEVGEPVPPELARGRAAASSPTRWRAAARSCSSSARPASSPPTRSCGPASPRPSRTSCGRRSRACSSCSSRWTFRARTRTSSRSRRAREVQQIGELIDDVLFLSELETGKEVVALGSTPVQPVLSRLAAELAERAARADLELRFEAEPAIELPLRPRMLRIVVENLAENALRYAGPRARFSIDVARARGRDRPARRRRRRRRRRGRPGAPVRALLPRRPGALLARHRARARDREARRHRRGRDDRGDRRPGPRARDPLRLPRRLPARARSRARARSPRRSRRRRTGSAASSRSSASGSAPRGTR